MNESTNRETAEKVVTFAGEFRQDWLEGKVVAPIPTGVRADVGFGSRLVSGAREVSVSRMLIVRFHPECWGDPAVESELDPHVLMHRLSAYEGASGVLVVTDNLLGAALLGPGYALVAGTERFMRAAVPEGSDKARVNFLRYARRVAEHSPHLVEIAAAFPPSERQWKSVGEIPTDSHTGKQLAFMNEFRDELLDGPAFARKWLFERSRAMNVGERVHDKIASIFDEVFYLLDDYVIDPGLRDLCDMTDETLRRRVSDVLVQLNRLGHS